MDITKNDPANRIDLPYVSITRDGTIICFQYKENTELGFPEIRELINCAEILSGNKPYVTFADVRINISITNEGKKVLSDMKNMPLFRGTAALVKNDLYKFAANFMNSFNKPEYPFRAFTSKEEAMEWLRSLPLN